MIYFSSNTRVFLAPGTTDMRKAIDSLSILVEGSMDLNPFSGHLFVFCNRNKTILKVLYWDRNGFCLWRKRLEKHQFKWPQSSDEVKEIGPRELSFLIEGLDIASVKAHEALHYSTMI
jgi:transposase